MAKTKKEHELEAALTKRRHNKAYRQHPEVKARRKAYMQAYRQRPKARAQTKAYHKAYYQRPKVKVYAKAYRQRPEVKARICTRMRAYCQRPEVKVRMQEYHRLPEVKTKKKAYASNPANTNRVFLENAIKRLSALEKRSPVKQERLDCYTRAWELNVLEGSLKKGEIRIPLCAINAGLKKRMGA